MKETAEFIPASAYKKGNLSIPNVFIMNQTGFFTVEVTVIYAEVNG